MTSIYKIEPTESVFSVTWNIGISCNYDCMYCPTIWHNNQSKHPGLSLLKQRWISIFDKTKHRALPYKISFTGGEVTANKNFLPLILWMVENYKQYINKILVTTNGSASLSYYTKLFQYVDNISFSLHSEHVNEEKFFNTIVNLKNQISNNKHIHVNIMDEFWNQTRIPYYIELLNRHGISNSVNQIDYSLSTRSMPIIKGKLNLEIPQSKVL